MSILFLPLKHSCLYLYKQEGVNTNLGMIQKVLKIATGLKKSPGVEKDWWLSLAN